MNDRLRKLGAPALPGVNLLPKDYAEKRKMRAVQVTALFAVLIALGVMVLGYFAAVGAKQLAVGELDDKRRDQALALESRDAKAHVYTDYLQQEQQEFTLAQVGYGEVLYSQFAPGVLAQADDETNFESLEFFGPSALGLGGVTTDPVFGGGVGTVQFAARTDTLEAANGLISRLELVPGLARVWGQTEQYTSDTDTVYYLVEGSAVITPRALTLRLMPDGLTEIDPTLFADPNYAPEDELEPETATSPEPGSDEDE